MLQTINNRAAAIRARRRAKGVTLLELAMYLGIAGIIAGGVMTYYSSSSNAQRVTDSLSMLGSVQQTVRAIYAGSSDFTGVDAAVVANSNQLPRKWVSGTTIKNPFNGSVLVAAANTNSRFTVSMTGLPRDACTKLAVADLGPGVASVAAASGASATVGADGAFLTPVTASTACSGAQNSIIWNFY